MTTLAFPPAARPPAAPPLPLLGPDGRPVSSGGAGWVAPHALNFASVISTVGKTYPSRWDEAIKDSPENALAMKRDCYYLGLLQERTAPTAGLNWAVKVPKGSGQKGQWVKERLTAAVEAIPDLTGLLLNQLEALWYGRYGSQILPGRGPGGVWTVRKHLPVNGDKIQYAWDGTPVVQVGFQTANRYRDDAGTVVTWDGHEPVGPVTLLDRGGYGLRLADPRWRERFVIHHHVADDADYFQGEMSGAVYGVGLRSRVYWSGWMKTETLGWMLSFMQGVGMMDLVMFNFPSGNDVAKRQAEANAKRVTNGLALLVARGPEERGYAAVEQVSMNTNGVKVLQDLIASYFDRHIERLFVGQSMSSGADDSSGLGGSGRAKFAQDTKFQLLRMDARRLGETLTRDLLGPLQRANCPGTEDVAATFEFAVPDPSAEDKLNTVSKFMDKMKFKQDEVYELIGMTCPGPGDETVGGQPAAGGLPGMTGAMGGGAPGPEGAETGRAATLDGEPEMPDESELPPDLLWGDEWPELYRQADQWQPYTVQAGPRKGQQAYRNTRTGELRDKPPEAGTPAQQPAGAVGRGVAAVKGAGRHVGQAASSALDEMPGGKAIKGLGKAAVAVFHAVEKPMMAAMATTQALARQAAYERGMTDAQVDVLGRVLFLADFAGGYGGAAVGYAAAGPIGGKVGSFMPTASVVYLAYSTARVPLATWRAAKRLVRARLAQAGQAAATAGGLLARGADAAAGALDRAADLTHRVVNPMGFSADGVPELYSAAPDLAGRVADSLRGAFDPDWWQACVAATLGDTKNPERALSLASEMADLKPVPDGAEIGAAMVHLAAAGDWDGVDTLADLIDSAPDGEDDSQPEQYATPVKWTAFAHKSGRQAWRSAGGLVRFTAPREQPVGPNIPKRVHTQRLQVDAQRTAVDLANRLAQGHPPTADELAGLPDVLRSLTSEQILALNKTVGANQGRLKADRVAHFIAKAKSVQVAQASTPPVAPPPTPPSGLPTGGTPTPPVQPTPAPTATVAARPPETPAAGQVTDVKAALNSALATAQLAPEQRQKYEVYVRQATERMPEGAFALIRQHMRGAKFHRSPHDIANALTADCGDPKYRELGGRIRGAFRQKSGVVYLDGEGEGGTYAHELAHAIDGGYKLSGSPEWQSVYRTEIDRDGDPLSKYARTKPSEGFAEFARLVYTGDLSVAEQRFPQASAFFKRNQLWPTSPPSPTSSPASSSSKTAPPSTATTVTSPAPTASSPMPNHPRPTAGRPAKGAAGRWARLFDKLMGGTGEGLESEEIVELVPAPADVIIP